MKKTFFIYIILLFNFNSELFSQRGNSNKKQLSYNENLFKNIKYDSARNEGLRTVLYNFFKIIIKIILIKCDQVLTKKANF